MFRAARGVTDDTFGQFAAIYTTNVLQAIATASVPVPAGAANPPQWHLIGPDLVANGQTFGFNAAGQYATTPIAGRVGTVAVDPANGNHILCGAAAGGIWESFTRGADWAPRTDILPTLTIGAIAFDPGNSKNVYAGTGEGNKYNFLGQGMLHSADGGTTWAILATSTNPNPFVGTGFFQIIVDPANSKHILAATTTGVYETTDTGNNWAQVYQGETWDLSMQPGGVATPEVLAGTVNGLQRSADGGHTWAAVALPSPPAAWTRLGVSITQPDSTVAATAYAFGASAPVADPVTGKTPPIAAYLWRRSGGTWTAVTPLPTPPANQTDLGTGQADYDWCVTAARNSTTQVYIGIFDLWRGDLTVGPGTPPPPAAWGWTNLSSKAQGVAGGCIHPDQHTIVVDPTDSTNATIYAGCDGGLYRSPDRGVNWTPLNAGLAIAETEYLTQDNSSARWLMTGLQDNGTLRYTGTSAFDQVGGGDGGDCGTNQAKPATCYHTYYQMGLSRSTDKGTTFADIDATKNMNVPATYNCLWYPPVGVSGDTVAQAGQSVFVSRDAGTTWTEVQLSNPAPAQAATALYLPGTDLIYAATGDGRVFSVAWSAATSTWTATELASPRGAYISAMRVDPAGRIWVTMSQIPLPPAAGGAAPAGGLVYMYNSSAQNWTDKTAVTAGQTLPQLPVNSIAFDPKDTTGNTIWVSADIGVWKSADGGTTWAPYYQSLPNALITDLEFHPVARVLRAATRNRGVWEVAVDTPGSSTVPPGVWGFSVLPNNTGGMTVFGVLTGNAPSYLYQTSPTSGFYGVSSLAGTTVSSPLVATAGQDKRLEVFARGPDGALRRNYQLPPNFGWSGWASLGGFLTGNPVTATNNDGRVEVFARGPDGTLWHIYQTAAGGGGAWSAWSSMGPVITSAPAVALDGNGHLDVFARGIDGRLGHIVQTTADSTGWSAWAYLGSDPISSKPAAAANTDGRLEVFARGPEGGLRRMSQATKGDWTAATWQLLDGRPIGDPSVTLTSAGLLAVAVRRSSDNSIWTISQSAAGSWADSAGGSTGSGWTSLGGWLASDPTIVCNQDGRLTVWVLGGGSGVTYNWQSTVGGSWGGWMTMGYTFFPFPSK